MGNTSKIREARIRKQTLSRYLKKLKCLTGRDLTPASLLSVEETESIHEQLSDLANSHASKFTIAFEDKLSERFRNYVENLYKANPVPVYLWIEESSMCGLIRLKSIKSVNFTFPFDVCPNGVITFSTADFRDRLLLDFFEDGVGQRMLEVESQGKHWLNVTY